MRDIFLLYFYSLLLFIVTFAVENNKFPVVSGILSGLLFVIASVMLVNRIRGWRKI